MSAWNHEICDECWKDRCISKGEPHRQPSRLKYATSATCCFCGDQDCISGIVVREDPSVPQFCDHDED